MIPMLIILPQLSDLNNALSNLTRAILTAAALILAIVVLGTWLLPKLLKLVLTWGSRELFLVSVVAAGVGVGYATHSVGLSFALGAFVAGLVLSEIGTQPPGAERCGSPSRHLRIAVLCDRRNVA